MALVNEPVGDALPNLTPMEYRYGLCRDRDGRRGVPYYAVRDVLPDCCLTGVWCLVRTPETWSR
jgi:hypothetical protein